MWSGEHFGVTQKGKARSSSPWWAPAENNHTQGNGVLEADSQKATFFGTVVDEPGNQQHTSPAHPMLPCTLGEGLTPHWLSFHAQQSTTSTVTAYCRQRYLCIVAQGSANTPRSQQSNTCKQVGCYFLHKQQYRMKNPKYPNTINCVKKHRLKAYKQTCIHKEKNTPCFLLQSWTPSKGKAAASRTSKLRSRIWYLYELKSNLQYAG